MKSDNIICSHCTVQVKELNSCYLPVPGYFSNHQVQDACPTFSPSRNRVVILEQVAWKVLAIILKQSINGLEMCKRKVSIQ